MSKIYFIYIDQTGVAALVITFFKNGDFSAKLYQIEMLFHSQGFPQSFKDVFIFLKLIFWETHPRAKNWWMLLNQSSRYKYISIVTQLSIHQYLGQQSKCGSCFTTSLKQLRGFPLLVLLNGLHIIFSNPPAFLFLHKVGLSSCSWVSFIPEQPKIF